LLLTQATNNALAKFHSFFLNAPATHISLLVKSNDEVYMYEGAANKGTQLRKLENYLEESNCKYIFWRQTYLVKDTLKTELLKYVDAPYDWNYIKYVLYHMSGFMMIYHIFDAYDKIREFLKGGKKDVSFSCSSLIGRIFTDLKIINPNINNSALYPSSYFYDDILGTGVIGQIVKIKY
jgi:hypothetical protein